MLKVAFNQLHPNLSLSQFCTGVLHVELSPIVALRPDMRVPRADACTHDETSGLWPCRVMGLVATLVPVPG